MDNEERTAELLDWDERDGCEVDTPVAGGAGAVTATDSDIVSEAERWHLVHGDCIEQMATMPPACVDFAVFSPPFPSLYAYTSSDADIGNSENMRGDAKLHLSFFYRQLVRIIKPGRVACVHVAQIPRMKRTGEVGLFDFRGMNIRLAERAGFVFEYDWCIRKNPQAQAIRTRSRELQFAGLESDRAKSRGTLPDYVLKFRVPGDNAVPVSDDENESRNVWRNRWIEWAECCWTDIKETDTLNVREAKGKDDTKHICPLQLGLIHRLVKLYTNRNEIVFSPFAGIGSEGYEALKQGRRFYGCELKQEYFDCACENLSSVVSETSKQMLLFLATP